MATVTLKLTTPQGYPFDLAVSEDDNGDEVRGLLERAEKLGGWLVGRGWGFADAQPSLPSVREIAAGPTFCGYPCSPTTDDRGFPTYIIADGRQVQRREKQGDVWYSWSEGPKEDRNYHQVLRIPKGEEVPPIVGLPAAA
ncbi:MAG: hypothetical protein WBO46_23175 [Caldilineaceae bacterium]